jgi:hypothetical protein
MARPAVPSLRGQPWKRLKISDPLVPPKPKEFERATSMDIGRAVLGT